MTDEQIVKALRLCADRGCYRCTEHGKEYCRETVASLAWDLIYRQQAEIESLEADYENVYKQATADILASIADGGTSCEWCIDNHRAEAVREFAERLKETNLYEFIEEYFNNAELCYEVRSDLFNDFVDNLVKEMTEKEGGKG
jgi:hypothetical protein